MTAGILVAAGLLAAATTADALVVYNETFDNDTGDNRGIVHVNWRANYGNGATIFDTSNTSTTGGPINARFSSPDGSPGIFWHGNFERFTRWIWWTEEQFLGDISQLDSISFAPRNAHSLQNTNGDEDLHVALRVGGNWFVSQEEFNNLSTDSWDSLELDVSSAAFQGLNFTSGSILGLPGAVTALPASGEVTAVGFYDDQFDSTIRVDDVVVSDLRESAVPEPASLGLISLAGLVLLNRRR
jgi:hypothetical protein